MNYDKIQNMSKILMEVNLIPIQGTRFQPTGFPHLGAATYNLPEDNSIALLVESTQSMANRLEEVCLDNSKKKLVNVLEGIPFVIVNDDNKALTNSILESHRLSSAYILNGKPKLIDEIKKEIGDLDKNKNADLEMISRLHKFLFSTDPNSLLHGVWFSREFSGRLKITRALSAFIEATEVSEVLSGGAKIDIINPGKDGKNDSKTGFANIPFSRMEYSAKKITAYFNLDVLQIIKYHISKDAKILLVCLALWKIQRFLEIGLRLRTACDFVQDGHIKIMRPDGFDMPSKEELEKQIRELVSKCKNEFREKPLIITYKQKK